MRQQVHLRCLHSGPLLYARTGRVEELSSLYLFSEGSMVGFKVYSKKKNYMYKSKLLDEVEH